MAQKAGLRVASLWQRSKVAVHEAELVDRIKSLQRTDENAKQAISIFTRVGHFNPEGISAQLLVERQGSSCGLHSI